MPLQALRDAFREQACELDDIDTGAYEACGKDSLEPILELGDPNARVGFFGRDPGRDEVRHGLPFVGPGGQMLRRTIYRFLYGGEMPGFDASLEVGRRFFWINAVPYKPSGNRAWPESVRRKFKPLIADLLVHVWKGHDLITLGRDAFLWFGIGAPPSAQNELTEFWSRPDRFSSTYEVELGRANSTPKTIYLHPLPHPSPANAIWYERFPELLVQRISDLDVSPT